MTAPAGEPVSLIVRAGPTAKAPGLRCLHTGKPPGGQTFAQSAFEEQGAGGFANTLLIALWAQNPQKTKAWVRSADVRLDVPVVSA